MPPLEDMSDMLEQIGKIRDSRDARPEMTPNSALVLPEKTTVKVEQ